MSFVDDLNAAANPIRNGGIKDVLPYDYDYSENYKYLSNNKDKIVNEIVTNIRDMALDRAKHLQKRSIFDNKREITVRTDFFKFPCILKPGRDFGGLNYKCEIEWKDLYLYIVKAAINELSKDGFYKFGACTPSPRYSDVFYYATYDGHIGTNFTTYGRDKSGKNTLHSLKPFLFECTICVSLK